MEEEHMRKKTYTKNTAVLLSDEQYDKLLWITDRLEMPLSEFIRMAVDEKMDSELSRLKKESSSREMNNERGLIKMNNNDLNNQTDDLETQNTMNRIYTIGHSNYKIEYFIQLLKQNNITAVYDRATMGGSSGGSCASDHGLISTGALSPRSHVLRHFHQSAVALQPKDAAWRVGIPWIPDPPQSAQADPNLDGSGRQGPFQSKRHARRHARLGRCQ